MRIASVADSGRPEIRFVVLPVIPYGIRVALIITLIAAGFAVQFARWLIPGVLLIAIGSLLGSVRSVNSKPEHLAHEGEWTEVLPDQWNRAKELCGKVRRWKNSLTNFGSMSGMALFIVIVAGTGVVFGLTIDDDPELALVLAVDVLALFGPFFFIGYLKAWEPPLLSVKLKALTGVLEKLEEATHPDVVLQPMLEVAKSTEADREISIPLDARLMIRFKDAPETFYGVQVQVSANAVQGTYFPYLYAVILYSKEFPADRGAIREPRQSWLVLEPSSEAEVTVLVLRQRTTKTSGYHTKEPRQLEIIEAALEMARDILRSFV